MIVLIDNYDSFVYNLARYLRELGGETHVVRNDAATVADIAALQPQAIVISPGPCSPAEAGISVAVLQQLSPSIPTLGVCLGHQALAMAAGGDVVRAAEPMHGRASLITHTGQGLFVDLPQPLRVGRYHSLVAERESLPAELRITAQTDDGVIMGLEHATWPAWGVQFHPESVLTEAGHQLLANFLRMAGLPGTDRAGEIERLPNHIAGADAATHDDPWWLAEPGPASVLPARFS